MRTFLCITIAFLGSHFLSSSYGDAPEPELKTAREVPVKYYLSLPTGWDASKEWPVVITIDGSGHDFLTNSRQFIQARKDLPFILVTPFITSNGNDPKDAEAILAIAREVQQEKHGAPKFFLTGFSAGGHVTWQLVFAHPEKLAGVALAAANYRGRGITTISTSPAREQLPIHAFQGTKDGFKQAMDEQWEDAQKQARDAGYQKLDHTVVEGAGHGPFAQQVISYFATLLSH